MLQLPIELDEQCSKVFLRCSELESPRLLRAQFVNTELAPFAHRLPSAMSNLHDFVEEVKVCLLTNELVNGEALMLPFLRKLIRNYPPQDALHGALQRLLQDIQKLPNTPSQTVPSQPPPATRLPDPQPPTPEEAYVDFELRIGPEGYVVATSPQGTATTKIMVTVPPEISELVTAVENNQTTVAMLKELGQALYNWLLPAPVHALWQATEAVAIHNQANVRLRLQIQPASIASLPLEFLHQSIGNYFFAINPATVLARHLDLPLPPGPGPQPNEPLQLLAIVSNPYAPNPRFNPNEWHSLLEQTLAQPLAAGRIQLRTVGATHHEIDQALLAQPPHLVQFVGHGLEKDGESWVTLVKKDGAPWYVDSETFADLLFGHTRHLRLLCMATCESGRSPSPQAFAGVAPRLVQRGLPAVVAMQYKVQVEAVRIFLSYFYAALAARKPADWAVQAGRRAVAVELGKGNREFATPMLYMRAKDGLVV